MDSFPSLPHRNSQDLNASFSLSLPSEPPDVGNWFSSYRYRSPDPDSDVNFEDSALKGCESEKDEEREKQELNCPKIRSRDEVVAGEKLLRANTYFGDDKREEDQSLAKPKDLDTFSFHSALLSEPPDIRNWFSSYAYESPMSGTSSHFEDSVPSEENGCEEMNLIIPGKDEHKFSRENVDTWESLTHNSFSDTSTRAHQPSTRDDGSVEMEEKVSFASTSHLEKVLHPYKQHDRPSQHNVNPTKCEKSTSFSHGCGGCKREQALTLDMDKNCTRTPDSVAHKTDMKEATSKAISRHENRGSSTTNPANVFAEWKSTRLREKENIDMTSTNGFVATKNRDGGTKDENCGKKTQEKPSPGLAKGGRDSTVCNKEGDMKRKALAEVTNVEISNDTEITGKWKCPRKGKSYVGHALKQLRLERWVHRN